MPTKHGVTYVTSSRYKREENAILQSKALLPDGTPVSDVFTFDFRELTIAELLEVDITVMVQAEVTQAYSMIKVPCVVEHAGLIFDDFGSAYPGGLTKPMWNTLGPRFVEETHSAGRQVTARAVVAYCDGMSVKTFIGETKGSLAKEPRGTRQFYWDSVFIPAEGDGAAKGLTYSEIVDQKSLGLEYKVLSLSQSTKAMLKFLTYLRKIGPSPLWP